MKVRQTPIAAAVTITLLAAAGSIQAQQVEQKTEKKAESTQQLDQVVITGIRASRESSLNAKRNSEALVEVVTAEDVGKMPDKNIADSLQRLPGVATSSASGGEGGFDENDRVSLRGTSASLTQTLINGHTLGSGDWFVLSQYGGTAGRSVSYTLLPAELVGRVTVYKSAQADIPEGGAVGAVNIETRRPLDLRKQFTLEGKAQVVYSDLPKKTDPQLSALLGWKNDAKNFGVIAQVFSETRNIRRDGIEIFGGYNEITNAAVLAAHPSLKGVKVPGMIGIASFEQERKRTGGAFELQVKPSNDTSLSLSGLKTDLKASNYNSNFLLEPGAMLAAGIVPTAIGVNNGVLTSATFAPQTTMRYAQVNPIYRPGSKADTQYLNLDGSWQVNSDLKLVGQIGTTKGHGKTDKEVGLRYDPTGSGFNYALNGLGSPTIGFTKGNGDDPAVFNKPGADWSWGPRGLVTTDKEDYASVDAEWALDKGVLDSVKFGARATKHERDIKWPVASRPGSTFYGTWPAWSGQTSGSGFGKGFGGNIGQVWVIPGKAIEEYSNLPGSINEDPKARGPFLDNYSNLKEDTSAAYMKLNLNGGDFWSGNVGLRVVRTSQTSKGWEPALANEAGAVNTFIGWRKPVTFDRSYTDVLPSATLKFTPSRDVIVRTSLAKTMARPDYGALSAAMPALNATLHTGDSGNPMLNPTRGVNMDLGAEWYFAPRSMVSATVFNQRFTSFTVQEAFVGKYLNEQTGNMEDFTVLKPFNGTARNRGFELAYQQALSSNFGLNANYTYADGSQRGRNGAKSDMVGNSKNTYNLEGYFENDVLSARMVYSYRSKFLAGLDRSSSLNMAGTGTLGASVNYKLTENLTLSFEALNLNDPTLKYYGDNTTQVQRLYNSGRQFYFGIRAKL